MSTRLGWAGLGGGRGGEGRILHSQLRPTQAYVLWAPTVNPNSRCLFLAFLPASYPFGKCETEAQRSVGVGWVGLHLDRESSLLEFNTPSSLGPCLVTYGRVEWA